MSKELSTRPAAPDAGGAFKKIIGFIGTDNLSLIFALAIIVLLITIVSGWFGVTGGSMFFTWQNLMNSLAQAIVIVGLLAMGESVVIIAGALDISVGSTEN